MPVFFAGEFSAQERGVGGQSCVWFRERVFADGLSLSKTLLPQSRSSFDEAPLVLITRFLLSIAGASVDVDIPW